MFKLHCWVHKPYNIMDQGHNERVVLTFSNLECNLEI